MRSARPLYQCFPSVLCVGKETTVTIVPRDTSRVFRPEWEYAIGIDGIMDDQLDYQNHSPTDHSYEIANGCLLFTFTPAKEQEYFVRLVALGKEFKLPLYAVEEDLYHLRPLKGDFHTHTYYSDGNNGITMTPADYREEGFDFFTLTDHNRRFTSVLAQELYKDVPLGMHIIPGEEVHTAGGIGARSLGGGICHAEDLPPEIAAVFQLSFDFGGHFAGLGILFRLQQSVQRTPVG